MMVVLRIIFAISSLRNENDLVDCDHHSVMAFSTERRFTASFSSMVDPSFTAGLVSIY